MVLLTALTHRSLYFCSMKTLTINIQNSSLVYFSCFVSQGSTSMFFMSDPACMVAFVHICEYFLCLNGSKAVFVEGQVFPAEGVHVGHPVLIKLKHVDIFSCFQIC